MWKIIPFEENYEVSQSGEVRNATTKHIKSLRISESGYYRVTLYPSGKTYSVHKLVISTWTKNPDNLPIINHKDGNKLNNNVSNLEWCTHSYNYRHARDVLKTISPVDWVGGKNPSVTLDYGLVYSLKFGVLNKIPVNILSKMFGLREETFRKILREETWKHVKLI